MGWFLLGLPHSAVGGAFRPASLYLRQIVHELLLHAECTRRAQDQMLETVLSAQLVLSAQWALEPGEGVNPALGTWPPVDSGLVVVAAKY